MNYYNVWSCPYLGTDNFFPTLEETNSTSSITENVIFDIWKSNNTEWAERNELTPISREEAQFYIDEVIEQMNVEIDESPEWQSAMSTWTKEDRQIFIEKNNGLFYPSGSFTLPEL